MAEQKKRMSQAGDPNPLESEERRVADAWDDPARRPGGSVSAEDVARPRDKEAARGGVGVVPGATGTGPGGSQAGRSLYGMAPEEEGTEDK